MQSSDVMFGKARKKNKRKMEKTEKEIEEFLKEIEILWKKYPYARFGQLLFNYTRFGTRTNHLGNVVDPFHFQDKDVLEEIKKENEK